MDKEDESKIECNVDRDTYRCPERTMSISAGTSMMRNPDSKSVETKEDGVVVKCQVVRCVDRVNLVVIIRRGNNVRLSTVLELVPPKRNSTV